MLNSKDLSGAVGEPTARNLSSLSLNGGKQVVDVESRSLIQKAHELYNVNNVRTKAVSANSSRGSQRSANAVSK